MEKATVLIMEDELVVAHDLEDMLIQAGYEVVGTASSGEEAVAMAKSICPDLVLADIKLKGRMDGIEAAERIKGCCDSAIVYLTARTETEAFTRAKLTEPYGYLSKPVAPQELLRTAEMALYKHKMEKRLRESEARYRRIVETATEGIWSMDREFRTTLVNERMVEMLGYSVDEILGQRIDSFMFREDLGDHEAKMEVGRRGGDQFYERRFRRKDGDVLWTRVSAKSLQDAQCNFDGSFAMFADITDFKKAEEELRKFSERLQLIFEGAAEGILVADVDTKRFKYANQSMCDLLGYSREDLCDLSVFDIHPREALDHVIAEFVAQAAGEKALASDIPCLRKDGAVIRTDIRTTGIEIEGILHNVGFFSDITERKRVEDQLRESEEKYRLLFTHEKDAILLSDAETMTILDSNPAAEKLWGGSREELLSLKIPDLSAEPEKTEKALAGVVRLGGYEVVERRLKKRDGTEFIAEISVEPFTLKGRTVVCSIVRDITQRKRAEEAAELEKRRFEALSDNSPFDLAVIEGNGTFRYINPKFKEMFGYELQDVPNGKEWFRKAYPESQCRHDVISAWLEDISQSGFGEQRPQIFTVTCRDGSKKIAHFRPIQLETGEHVMTCEDITERYEAEEKLRRSEEEFRRIVENLQDAFYRADMNGVFTFLSPASERVAGYKPEEGVGLPITMFYADPDERQEFMKLIMENGFLNNFEARLVHKDGHAVWVSTSARLYKDKDGNIAGVEGIARDISDRKRMQMALTESEEMFRLLSEQSLMSVAILQEGVYKYSNQTMSDLCEYSLEEISKWGPEEFLAVVHPEDRSLVMTQARMKQLGDPQQTTHYAFRIITKSGMTKWVEIYSKTIEFRGSPANLLSMLDVTERRKAEEALLESEATLRTLVQAAPIGIGQVSADRTLGWTNDLLCKMLGYSGEELAGQSARILYESYEEFLRVGREKHPEEIRHGTGSVETRFRRKDGSVFPVLLSSSSIVREDLSHGLVFTAMDITDRKSAEEQIRLNEERLQSLYDIARYKAETLQDLLDFTLDEAVKLAESKVGYIYLYDEEKRLLELNSWSKEVMKECELAEPQTCYELDRTGIWGEAVRQRKPIVLNDFHAPNELKKGYPEGHVSLHNFMTIPVFEGDKIVAVVGVANKDSDYDESDVRQLTLLMDSVWRIAAAKRSEILQRRAATALEHAAEGVIITDTDGTIQYVNSSLERMTGYSQDELLGNNPRILKSGEQDRAFYENLWRTIVGGGIWTGRFVNKRKDGNLYTEDATISPVRDGSGTITGFVGMKRDITEHLALSRQLGHAQKMEAVGTLAGGLAHDFNNILQAILGYSDLILMKRGRGDPDRKKLEVIQQAARDGADLVSRILTFSRKAESKRRPVDLKEEIRKAQRLLRRTIPRMIDIQLMLAENLQIIEADPGQIEQILLNLAVNAQHAMPNGGQLLIEAGNVSLSDEYLRSHLGAKPGRYVLLSVSDTGKGIDTEFLERIFEPFFTTKPSGQGTGLGLSMVHGIVSQHGGYIRCYSEPGKGTCFKIYLPVSERELDSDLALTREMPAFGSETILLVDDDDRIRAMGTQMIEMGGYEVLTAKSGEEALDIHSLHKERIALVILDLNMPGMGGQKCLEELLRIVPDIRVLVASGYSSNGHAGEQVSIGARGFVNKPYDSKDILTAIRRVLDLGGL